jgi:hypothetical protein
MCYPLPGAQGRKTEVERQKLAGLHIAECIALIDKNLAPILWVFPLARFTLSLRMSGLTIL